MIPQRELKFLNALNAIPNVGSSSLRSLKKMFGSFEAAWLADEQSLQSTGLESPALQGILWKRPSIHPDKEMEKLVKEKIWMVTDEDASYPVLLREISYPPLLLYGQGNIDLLATLRSDRDTNEKNRIGFGVVGTRKPTIYGLEATETVVSTLSETGLVIVSGLAIGIDTKAHETSLAHNGKTIAVLGSGVNTSSIFPQENCGLARRIIESGGAVISEYTPGTPAVKEHFPQRNRIISGLSRGVLVIEARERSGALITARFALEQNRDVFAIPGSVFSLSSHGPHRLIQEGAKLVMNAEDILEELGLAYTKEALSSSGVVSEKELIILELLEENPDIDVIKEKTKFDTAVIMTTLSMLELKGLVKNMGNDTYQRIK